MTVKRILILGGGYVGLYSALALEKALPPNEAEITLVNRENYMVYQPFLPEAASGSIEPRHVVVPLRQVLTRTRLVTGRVTSVDHELRIAAVEPWEGAQMELGYNILVVALGSVSRVLPIPGLAENAIGFKSVEEAIFLRNQVISRLDAAESAPDEATRNRVLTFVFVGGGYAGVEALAELEDLARDACDHFPSVQQEDMRWVLIEARGEILPEMGPGLGNYALERLRRRGIEVHLNTTLESAEHGKMRLSDGDEFEADTLVWTTGVRPHPLVSKMGLPTDDKERLVVDEHMRVVGVPDAWAAGDCAAVPDPSGEGTAPPTAQHALREAKVLGANIAATLRGKPLRRFTYRGLGMLVSLGRYKGVARVFRWIIQGFPAWFLHRTYHLSRIPTWSRKFRVVMDWTVALFFKRDIVQLGSLHHPKEPFEEAFKG